jgi:hypothetical protein
MIKSSNWLISAWNPKLSVDILNNDDDDEWALTVAKNRGLTWVVWGRWGRGR